MVMFRMTLMMDKVVMIYHGGQNGLGRWEGVVIVIVIRTMNL